MADHVALVTGLKHYMGSFENYAAQELDTPFTEELPRVPGPNFYYTQEDILFELAAKHGFTLFPEKGFESVTLTCVNNGAKPGGRTTDVAKLQKLMKDRGILIDGGYGKTKGTTFRLSNMGDETEATINDLVGKLDESLKLI